MLMCEFVMYCLIFHIYIELTLAIFRCQTAGNTGENVISQVAHDHIYPHPSSLSNAGLPAKSTCPVHETQCYTLPQLPTFNVASNFVSSQTQTYEENAMKVLHSRLKFPKMHKYQHQITTMSPGGRFGNLPANDLHAISYPTFSRLSVPSCPKSAMPRLLFASSRFQFSSLGLHRVSSFAHVPNVSILKSVYHQHRTNKVNFLNVVIDFNIILVAFLIWLC